MAGKKLLSEWAIEVTVRKARNRIKAIGVELEGGWTKNPAPYIIQRDGSVKDIPYYASIGDRYQGPEDDGIAGELPSPPLDVRKGFEAKAEPWIRKYYPVAINHTCGMHVHMSFQRLLHYMYTMRSEYPATVIKEMKKWAEEQKLPQEHIIWERLAGQSDYCQFVYSGPDQILNKGKDYDKRRVGNRYSVINYSFGRTGTVECRLLPMFDNVELALSAIKRLMDVTNAFFVVTAKREKDTSVSVDGESRNREVREIYVN